MLPSLQVGFVSLQPAHTPASHQHASLSPAPLSARHWLASSQRLFQSSLRIPTGCPVPQSQACPADATPVSGLADETHDTEPLPGLANVPSDSGSQSAAWPSPLPVPRLAAWPTSNSGTLRSGLTDSCSSICSPVGGQANSSSCSSFDGQADASRWLPVHILTNTSRWLLFCGLADSSSCFTFGSPADSSSCFFVSGPTDSSRQLPGTTWPTPVPVPRSAEWLTSHSGAVGSGLTNSSSCSSVAGPFDIELWFSVSSPTG